MKEAKISGNICILDEGPTPSEGFSGLGGDYGKTLGMAEQVLQAAKKEKHFYNLPEK